MKITYERYLNSNPLIIFFPFLILFILVILKFNREAFQGDEFRYYQFSKNLLMGFYSPPKPNVNLWNGPGYPLFIAPFVWLDMPVLAIKLVNAFLQYFSIILLFLAINKYTSRKLALSFSFFWAFYYISYQELPLMLTEPLTSFLTALIVFLVSKMNESQILKKKYLIFVGIAIGYLALTKIIFGYVIMTMLFLYIIVLIFNNANSEIRRIVIILLIAFLVNIPYLAYTFNMTGKFLYWGNSGGSSLYWMSTPIEGEFGEWNNSSFTANCGHDLKIPCNSHLFAKNHQLDMKYLSQFNSIEQDDELKKIAIKNIKSHPMKYLRNCVSNFSRIFFGIPNSYFYQREQTAGRLFPNSIVLTIFIFCISISAVYYRRIRSEVSLIGGLTIVYLMLSTLVSAYPRQLYVILPFMFFWASYIFDKAIIFKFNKYQ